jgi:hypothetical protein
MTQADRVFSTPRRTASKIQTEKRARKADLATVADELKTVCEAVEALHRKYGDDADSRKDYLKLEDRRFRLLHIIGSTPALSQSDIEAKAAAIALPETLEDHSFAAHIAGCLAQDILHRGDVNGRITAIADKFEKLLAKYVDAHLVWARLARKAGAVVDAKFPDGDWAGGKTPACRLLVKTLRKNGCNAAQARLSVIFKQMTALAKVIEKDKSQSVAALRAKCLVALWEAIPGSADNEGCLTFDDEYPANLLFRATAAFTGLSPSVEVIEAKLGEEA